MEGLDGINNIWRDIKVVNDVMYIGAEVSFHGIQTYDLTTLEAFPRNGQGVPIVSPHYTTPELGATHNIVAAPEAGKMIAVGMSVIDKTCPGMDVGDEDKEMFASLAIFDVSNDPIRPLFEECVYVDASRGYVHDAHCIKYHGPFVAYQGVNICALFMEDEVVILNLDTLETINEFTYDTQSYVHQGWFSEDHTTLYTNDEIDELDLTTGTDFSTCYIFDVTNLDGVIPPPVTFITPSAHPSIDHNLYIKDGYTYQAHYTSGARINKIKEDKTLEEVAFFDGEGTCECVAAPDCTCDSFAGTWTYFPYFDSGITIAGGTAEGLFILQPKFDLAGELGGLTLTPGVYTTAAAVDLTGILTLDGPALGVWTFHIGGALTTAAASQMVFNGGGTAANVHWMVDGAITTGGVSVAIGDMEAGGAITLGAGALTYGSLDAGEAITLGEGALAYGALTAVGPITLGANARIGAGEPTTFGDGSSVDSTLLN